MSSAKVAVVADGVSPAALTMKIESKESKLVPTLKLMPLSSTRMLVEIIQADSWTEHQMGGGARYNVYEVLSIA